MLQQVSNAATSSGSNNSGSIGSQLMTAIEQMGTSSATTQDPLLDSNVNLSSGTSSTDASASQTYNAQGLLSQVQSAMMLNDPLLQSTGIGDSASNMFSSLPGTATTTTDASSSTTAATNANLAQTFKNDPTLVSVYVQTKLSQGILNMFS
jgi:hypothetical protein